MPPIADSPFVSFVKRHWVLVSIAGFALVVRSHQRQKKGELDAFNVLSDMGMVLCPLVGLATLNHIAHQDHEIAQLAAEVHPQPAPTPPGAAGLGYARGW